MADLINPHVEIPTEDVDGTLWEVFALYCDLRLSDSCEGRIETAVALTEFEMYIRRRPVPTDLNDEALIGFVRWYVGNENVPTSPPTLRTALLRADRLLSLWKFAANARYVDWLPRLCGRPRHFAGEDAAWLKQASLWEAAMEREP